MTRARRSCDCEIVRSKRFLRKIYEEWYRDIVAALPPCDGPVLELGSGAGFSSEFIPGLITSEIFATPGAALVMDAHSHADPRRLASGRS